MNILARLKISTKILFLLLMLGAVTVTVSLVGSHNLSVANNANNVMVQKSEAPIYVARANRNAVEIIYAGYRTVAWPGSSKEAADAAREEQTAYESVKARLADVISSAPDLKPSVVALESDLNELHTLTKQAINLGLVDKDIEATAILVQASKVSGRLIAAMKDINAKIMATNSAEAARMTATSKSQSFWMVTVSIVSVIGSIGIGLIVSSIGITGPLSRLKTTMQTLADGNNDVDVQGTDRRDEVGDMAKVVLVFRETAVAKAAADAEKVAADTTVQMVVTTLGTSLTELSNRNLTTRVTADYPGLYADLKDNYNDALESVRATIQQVSESARAISTGADEIAEASEDLARRTEGNAASLEQTSAALTQMEGRLKASVTASQSTVERADQAMGTVDSGRSTAATAMQAMGRVSDSAKGIDNVIEGLDKIAFQTRVLAMNAAVEAGRAGDAGRGFAVVADLVSALAMRAEEEAKRARDQLTVTQSEIVTAVGAVGQVDIALAAISSDVGEVNKLLALMASDNQAQSSTITEITAAVSTMDRATQQNAAMVEETSAAARNLTQEVGNLASAAAQFNVDGGGMRHATAARSATTRPVAAQAIRASAVPHRPAPKTKPTLNGHANGHANGKAADNDWADF